MDEKKIEIVSKEDIDEDKLKWYRKRANGKQAKIDKFRK